jgi:hypothetical protein
VITLDSGVNYSSSKRKGPEKELILNQPSNIEEPNFNGEGSALVDNRQHLNSSSIQQYSIFDEATSVLESALIDHTPIEVVNYMPSAKRTLMMGPKKRAPIGIDSYSNA